MQFTNGRGRQLLTVLLVLTVVSALAPGVAAGQQQRTGGAVVVEADETVRGDLEAFAGSVVVRGTVTGDVEAFAGSVRVDGSVGGDVAASAGSVEVGENGSVGGNLSAAAGSVRIAGAVAGDVDAAAETVTLAQTARIGGDLTYAGELVREDGATVAGVVTQGEPAGAAFENVSPSIPPVILGVYGFLANAALGVILLLAFPTFSRRLAARATGSPLRSGGVGLLVLVGVPVALVVVALTIVGIPLSVLGAVLYAIALWVGAVYGRYAVGTWVVGLVGIENRWVALLVGLLVVGLVTLVPILGGIVDFLVLLVGLGALSLVTTDRYRRRRTTVEPVTEPSGDDEATPA